MPRGPFTGRRRVSDAKEHGAKDKFTPGTYIFRISRGIYNPDSKSVEDAEWYGIESTVVKTLVEHSAEENAPYGASRRPGQSASWVFNLNPAQKRNAYLPMGNVKNLVKAVMETHGFQECFGYDSEGEPLPTQSRQDRQLWEDFEEIYEAWDEGRDLDEDVAERNDMEVDEPDPFNWVGDQLCADEGERFAGLCLRGVARDARGKDKRDNDQFIFCAVTCYPLEADEVAEYLAADTSAAEAAEAADKMVKRRKKRRRRRKAA